jgi:hypothetical protein
MGLLFRFRVAATGPYTLQGVVQNIQSPGVFLGVVSKVRGYGARISAQFPYLWPAVL